jgi:hypothetical protein
MEGLFKRVNRTLNKEVSWKVENNVYPTENIPASKTVFLKLCYVTDGLASFRFHSGFPQPHSSQNLGIVFIVQAYRYKVLDSGSLVQTKRMILMNLLHLQYVVYVTFYGSCNH